MPEANGYEPGSYGDWLTNPGFRAAAAEQSARVAAAIEHDRLEMPDVVALVRELFTERDEFVPRARLFALGLRARDGILRALADESRLWGVDTAFAGRGLDPYDLIIRLLGEPPPREAEPWLLRDARCGVPRVRKTALGALAQLGTDDALGTVVAALGDAADDVTQSALWALARIAQRGAVPTRHRGAILRQLEPLLGVRRHVADAMRLLAALDPDAAAEFVRATCTTYPAGDLLDVVLSGVPTSLHERLRGARDLFDGLVAAGDWRTLSDYVRLFAIDAGRLHALARSLATQLDESGAPSSIREYLRPRPRHALLAVLERLAADRDPELDVILGELIALDHQAISGVAAWLRLRIRGAPTDLETPSPEQMVVLPAAVRKHLALSLCDGLVGNGGIAHAVECLSDQEWIDLDAALREIAPPSCAWILRAGFALLIGERAVASLAARQQAIAARYATVESELDELDRQYHAIHHRIAVALAEHRLRHKELFATLDPRKASLPGDQGSR